VNWRRGLLRLWAVASAGWIAWTAYDVHSVAHLIDINWWKVAAWAVVPPAVGGILVLAALWVGQGFRKPN